MLNTTCTTSVITAAFGSGQNNKQCKTVNERLTFPQRTFSHRPLFRTSLYATTSTPRLGRQENHNLFLPLRVIMRWLSRLPFDKRLNWCCWLCNSWELGSVVLPTPSTTRAKWAKVFHGFASWCVQCSFIPPPPFLRRRGRLHNDGVTTLSSYQDGHTQKSHKTPKHVTWWSEPNRPTFHLFQFFERCFHFGWARGSW